MVEEKAAAGKRAVGVWLSRYKAEVGDAGIENTECTGVYRSSCTG